jgi:phosphocarrier protein HPr
VSQTASAVVTIANKLGLHARPATLFVQTAATAEAAITVRRMDQDECVDGKSIMQMMMLAATQGTKIEITAVGSDAQDAVAMLVKLVKGGFEEE